MARTVVTVLCQNPACGKQIIKSLAEFNHSEKIGRRHFCSLKCFGKYQGVLNFGDKANHDTSHLRDIERKDEFSAFRNYMKIIRKSAKQRKKEATVTLQDIKDLWESQKGICPYTGWELLLPASTTDYKNISLTINRASIDRIDSAKGYIPGNIQFVAVIANFGKNIFSEEQLIRFCHQVYEYRIECTYSPPFIDFHRYENNKDKYSAFRHHLRLAKRRSKLSGRECTITLEDLKKQWDSQVGYCAYTGCLLDNPTTSREWRFHQLEPKTASLDRIDSSYGYIPGNIQFVAVMANYAKRDFHENRLFEFCEAVAKYRKLTYLED